VPDHLIFTLNRFVYKTSPTGVIESVKIMDQLEYPNEIVIDTWSIGCAMPIAEKYELISIIVHSGSSIHHGHYYSYVKNPSGSSKLIIKGKWEKQKIMG
jgi:ubiquitin C-terminal hydrolase